MWLLGGPSTPSISCVTTTPIRGAAVHEARKDTKKLRSVLRLVRESLGDSNYGAKTTASGTPPATLADVSRRSGEEENPRRPLGECVYAEKPRAFTKRIEKLWVAKRV